MGKMLMSYGRALPPVFLDTALIEITDSCSISSGKKPERPVFNKAPKCPAHGAYNVYRCAEARIGAYRCVVEMRASALDFWGAWPIGLGT